MDAEPLKAAAFDKKFEIFKELADTALTHSSPLSLKKEYFRVAAASGHDRFVEYVGHISNLQPTNFDPEEIFSCWINCNDRGTVEILRDFGFDPNLKNSNGLTPLLKVLQHQRLYGKDFTEFNHVAALLDAGADPEATAKIREYDEKPKRVKSALDLASTSEVKSLLQKAIDDRKIAKS